MMKGKPKGGAAGKVASSTLAYPGNSFKYSPKCPTDEPEQKLNTFDVTTCTTLQSIADNTTRSVVSNKQAIGSAVLSSTGTPHNELTKVVSDADPLQRQSRLHSQRCDEIYSLSEDDTSGSGGQNQEQLQSEKVIVEVLHKVEKDIWEMEHFSKEHAKEARNGPKIYKNSSVAASERC